MPSDEYDDSDMEDQVNEDDDTETGEDDDDDDDDDDELESDNSGLEHDDDSGSEEANDDKTKKKNNKKNDTKRPTIEAHIVGKYEKLKGKQLFVLFPKKLPQKKDEFEKKVKSLNSRIINAIQPRQKSCRYCLIQFDSEKDCKKAMIELKKLEIDGKKLVVKIPKTDSDEFIKEIAKNKAAKNLKFRENLKLKKLAKKEARKKSFTSTLIVSNIPSSATAADVTKLFPDSVELRFTLAKGVENTSTATVSLPSPRDATNVQKKKLKIGGNNLKISFAVTNNLKKKEKKSKKKNIKSINENNKTNIDNSASDKNIKKRKHKEEKKILEKDVPSTKKPKVINVKKASNLKKNGKIHKAKKVGK